MPPLYLLNQTRCLTLRPLSESILPNIHNDPTPKEKQATDPALTTPQEETPPKKKGKKCNEH